jgi:ankyrin repeat protein
MFILKLLRTTKYGHFEIVKLLLLDSRVNPSDDNNCAIQYASWNGHVKIVELSHKSHPRDWMVTLRQQGSSDNNKLDFSDTRVDPSDDE